MNAKQLIAAVFVMSAATAAFAQQAEVTSIASSKTRAEVTTELKQAQDNGSATTYGFLGTSNPAAAAGNAAHATSSNVIASGKTRAEVIAELKEAQANGTALSGSFAGYLNPVAEATNHVSTQIVANK